MKIKKILFVVFITILLFTPGMIYAEEEELDPIPSGTPMPTPTATLEPSPSPTKTPEPTPSNSPTPSPSPSESPKPTLTPTPTPTSIPDKIDVSLNKETLGLREGETTTLEVTITPSSTNTEKPIWKSSDESVASVDSNGKVTAKKKGTAIITVTVGEEKDTCKVTVREISEDAKLAKLVISNGTLSPEFKPDVYEYSVTIDDATDSLDIKWELANQYASYFGPSDSRNKDLRNGDVLELKVIAEAGNSQIYKLTIVKENGINSVALKKLEISGYALNEVFHPDTLNYTADIPNVVDKITVQATPQDENSKISITGISNLQVGKNHVKVTVKDKDGNSRVYTIVVTRDEKQEIEENPTSIITSQITDNAGDNSNHNSTSTIPPVTPSNPDSFLKYFIVSFACLILMVIGGIGIYFFMKTSPKRNQKKKNNSIDQELDESSPIVEITENQETKNKPNIELFETKEFQIDDLSPEVLDDIYDDSEDV